jgi:hypothetical protein
VAVPVVVAVAVGLQVVPVVMVALEAQEVLAELGVTTASIGPGTVRIIVPSTGGIGVGTAFPGEAAIRVRLAVLGMTGVTVARASMVVLLVRVVLGAVGQPGRRGDR